MSSDFTPVFVPNATYPTGFGLASEGGPQNVEITGSFSGYNVYRVQIKPGN